jgi:hypothetical protein
VKKKIVKKKDGALSSSNSFRLVEEKRKEEERKREEEERRKEEERKRDEEKQKFEELQKLEDLRREEERKALERIELEKLEAERRERERKELIFLANQRIEEKRIIDEIQEAERKEQERRNEIERIEQERRNEIERIEQEMRNEVERIEREKRKEMLRLEEERQNEIREAARKEQERRDEIERIEQEEKLRIESMRLVEDARNVERIRLENERIEVLRIQKEREELEEMQHLTEHAVNDTGIAEEELARIEPAETAIGESVIEEETQSADAEVSRIAVTEECLVAPVKDEILSSQPVQRCEEDTEIKEAEKKEIPLGHDIANNLALENFSLMQEISRLNDKLVALEKSKSIEINELKVAEKLLRDQVSVLSELLHAKEILLEKLRTQCAEAEQEKSQSIEFERQIGELNEQVETLKLERTIFEKRWDKDQEEIRNLKKNVRAPLLSSDYLEKMQLQSIEIAKLEKEKLAFEEEKVTVVEHFESEISLLKEKYQQQCVDFEEMRASFHHQLEEQRNIIISQYMSQLQIERNRLKQQFLDGHLVEEGSDERKLEFNPEDFKRNSQSDEEESEKYDTKEPSQPVFPSGMLVCLFVCLLLLFFFLIVLISCFSIVRFLF